MKVILLIIMLAVATISCITICSTKKKLNVGDSAPDFSLPDQNGTNHTLSQLRGNNVVLYFYPMDDTPGCTQQACNIRDNFSQFTDANIIVLGLSKGSSKSKLSFATKYSLPFPLLTATKKVLSDYGTIGSFFRGYLPKRHTFLIDKNGIIIAIITDVSVNQHAQQIIDEFKRAQ